MFNGARVRVRVARALVALVASATALVTFDAQLGQAQESEPPLIASSMTPGAEELLETAPDSVRISFDSPLDSGAITVYDEHGGVLASTDDPATPASLEAELPPITDGTYLVSWDADGVDGGSGSGGYIFRIDSSGLDAVDARAAVSTSTDEQTAARTALVLVQVTVWAGAIVLVGTGISTVANVSTGERRRWVTHVLWASWGLTLAAVLVGFALDGLRGTGLGLSDAIDPSLWKETVDTTAGTAWLGAAIVLGVAAPAISWVAGHEGHRRRPLALVLGGILSIGLLACLALATPVFDATDQTDAVSVSEATDAGSLELTLAPGAVGANEMHLYLFDESGLPAEPTDVSLHLRSLSAGVGPIDAALVRAGPNHFLSYDLPLPFAGDWEIEVVATSVDGDSQSTLATVEVR